MSLHTWCHQSANRPSSCVTFTLNSHWGRAATGKKVLGLCVQAHFGHVLLFGTLYWQQERDSGINWLHAVLVFHLFALYATLWYIAGWRAAYRMLTGRTGWAKTDRSKEPPKDDVTTIAGRPHVA